MTSQQILEKHGIQNDEVALSRLASIGLGLLLNRIPDGEAVRLLRVAAEMLESDDAMAAAAMNMQLRGKNTARC